MRLREVQSIIEWEVRVMYEEFVPERLVKEFLRRYAEIFADIKEGLHGRK